jgi:DNA-binding NtrC family response regulator
MLTLMNRKLRLLIVDDDKDLLDPVIEVCGRFDFEVVGATSGQEALDMLKTNAFDVVMTDIRMQPMGGFALMDNVRAAFASMPFILWTGFWDFPEEQRAATYENVERLEKPFTFRELESTLKRVRVKIHSKGA